jgi:hypothetical protein
MRTGDARAARSARSAGGAPPAAIAVGAASTAGRALIALCATWLARAPLAYGEDADREAAGSVVIGGGAGDHDRTVVAAAVAVAAREAGWSLPREPVTKQDADRLFNCGDPSAPWACIPAAIGEHGARRIFAFAVDKNQADNGAPMVVLTARLIVTAAASSGQALVVRQRFCEHCADDRLTEASIDLARQLLQDLAVRNGRTILEVASTPPGARITLDGEPLGATNATFNTFPGAHVVVVEKLGYHRATRSVIAEEGKTATVALALVPSASAAGAARPARWLPGMLAGGGALAIVAAGILLERGAQGGPGHPDEKYRYAGATPAGVAIGLAGIGAFTAGLYLWWRAPAPTPATSTNGGPIAGWATAF